MSLSRKLTSALALALAASCGGTETPLAPEAQAAAADSEARTPLTLPPVTRLGEWNDRLLYSESARTVFTFVVQSPTDATNFQAIGADLTHHLIVFRIEGSKTDELGAFNGKLGQTVARLNEISSATSFRDGVLNEINLPPPVPHNPPGDGELAARLLHVAGVSITAQTRALTEPLRN